MLKKKEKERKNKVTTQSHEAYLQSVFIGFLGICKRQFSTINIVKKMQMANEKSN